MKADRHSVVDRVCEQCGKPFQARKERVDAGLGRFCGMKCVGLSQRKTGKEFAYYIYDKTRKTSYAGWKDENGKQHRTTYARWLWEMNNGEVPEGYRCRWKDGNAENHVLENVELISKEQFGREASDRLMGHGFSNETIKKMSVKKKGKKLSDSHRANMSVAMKKKWASGVYSHVHIGKYHRNWRGGVSNGYPRIFNKDLKDFIHQRDKYSCRVCNSGTRLAVHHIDADKMNNEHDNLITLCKRCHLKVHDTSPKEKDPIILAFRSKLKVLSNLNVPK